MHPPLYGVATGPADKPAILFLHGFLGAHDEWAGFIEPLSAEYRCLAVDLPGHGKTPPCDDVGFYSFEGAARAILDFLRSQRVQRTHLVGYSMGGRLALYLAVHHPEVCDRLIIESSSPGLLSPGEAAERRAHDAKWAARFEREPLDAVVDDWYLQPLFASLHDHPAAFARLRARRLRNRPKEVGLSMRGMSVGAQEPLWDRLGALDREVVLVVGERDRKYRLVADRMSDLSARIQTVMVSGAGHNAHVEQPDEFGRILRDAIQ